MRNNLDDFPSSWSNHMRCKAITFAGQQCRNRSVPGSIYCQTHISQKSFVFDLEQNNKARGAWKEWCNHGYGRSMPDICHDLVCGAKTRAGSPCRRRDLYRSGRCRLHGGLSTGPRTVKGMKKVVSNLPWMKKREIVQNNRDFAQNPTW